MTSHELAKQLFRVFAWELFEIIDDGSKEITLFNGVTDYRIRSPTLQKNLGRAN